MLSAPTKKPSFWLDFVLLLSPALWGSTFFVIKDSVQTVSPLILVGYRFLLAALIMGSIVLIKKKSLFHNFLPGLILGLLLWATVVFQTFGLQYTSASNSGFVTGMTMAFVPLFSWLFFRTVPSLSKSISVAIALLGLYILVGGVSHINKGDALTLVTAMAFALYILMADACVKDKVDPLILNFQQFFVIAFVSLVPAFFSRNSFTIAPHAVGSILYLAILPTVGAFMLQLTFQKFTLPIKVALIFATEPVFAAIFAWTLGGETFVFSKAIGGLLIVMAMILAEVPWITRID